MATVGLFFINTANYLPFNVSGQSAIAAISGGMAIALFSYLGVLDRRRGLPNPARPGTACTTVGARGLSAMAISSASREPVGCRCHSGAAGSLASADTSRSICASRLGRNINAARRLACTAAREV